MADRRNNVPLWLPSLAAAMLALLVVGIVGKLALDTSRQRQASLVATGGERHTEAVIITGQQVMIALQDAQIGQRGYLVIGNPDYLDAYVDGRARVLAGIERLRRMTADNPAQAADIARLNAAVRTRLADLETGLTAAGAGASRAVRTAAVQRDAGKAAMDDAKAAINAIVAREDRLLSVRRSKADAAAAAAARSLDRLVVVGSLLAVAAIIAGLVALRIRRQLRAESGARLLAERAGERDAALARLGALVGAIGEAIPDFIYAKDRQGRMTYANPATLAGVGLRWEEVEGRTDREFLADPEQGARIMATDEAIMASGQESTVDDVLTTADGAVRVYRSTKSPLRDADGTVIGLCGVSTDVTERRRAEEALRDSEQRFRSLSATLPALIFRTDAGGAAVYANRVFQDFTGQPEAAILGWGWGDWVHPDDRDRVMAQWKHCLDTGEDYVINYRYRRHDGVYRWFAVRGTPVRSAEGGIAEWVGAATDAQDMIDARDALAAANAELETSVDERTAALRTALETLERENVERRAAEAQVRQLQKMESIGQLTGGIAHDFNNMLGVVIGSLDLAKRRLTKDPAKAALGIEYAEEGARRAAQLTARLLAFARQQPLEPVPLAINRLVASMSELLQRTLGEGVQIETVLAGGLWSTFADASGVENAILNLGVNARDAMGGEGRLTIETANARLDDDYAKANPEATPGQYVMLAVTDTGSGMPPEVLARAFDPFFTTKAVGSGTGLGLSQVYGFVKQSGGHVRIYSETGAGTTIRLYLPRHHGAAAAEPTAATDAGLAMARPGERILVVEDDDGVRAMTAAMLVELGYDIETAADGDSALALLEGGATFTLMLTDIVMPGMNGRVLADRTEARWPAMKLLFTTGYTHNAVVHNGMVDPGVAFLAKPFSLAALAAKLRSVLDA